MAVFLAAIILTAVPGFTGEGGIKTGLFRKPPTDNDH
jgi:hypothetical protein